MLPQQIMTKMEKKAKSPLLTRTLSGAVFAVIVIGAILFSEYTFAGLLIVICFGSMREFYSLAEKSGASPMKHLGTIVGLTGVLGTAVIVHTATRTGTLSPLGISLALAIPVLLFSIFICELYRKQENPLVNIAVTITGIVYAAMPLAALVVIAALSRDAGMNAEYAAESSAERPWAVLCYILLVWANDVGAYLFGVAFGKHRLFERISPKKSWEGFFGGLIVAVGGGILAGHLLGQSMVFWGGLATVVVVTGVLGDLVESMFKRAAGVKDSGAIMPGHGGFLDRFDALLISAPFVMVYFIIFAQS